MLSKMFRRYPTGKDNQVASSCLASAQYDPRTLRLDVTFARSGAKYGYGCVSMDTFKGLMDADRDPAGSVGRYFVRNIRNTHPMIKVS